MPLSSFKLCAKFLDERVLADKVIIPRKRYHENALDDNVLGRQYGGLLIRLANVSAISFTSMTSCKKRNVYNHLHRKKQLIMNGRHFNI